MDRSIDLVAGTRKRRRGRLRNGPHGGDPLSR
jgi:hypothetical protein